ncbi:cutinase family protein [Nocardia cyriacigeorgica]|uniref:cutinase family protein n=1 Tax=Nocardia TaxID=1817 RepID=UPI001894E23F|nr:MULTISPECIES: cutinase family protein [Nocardia]MBF6100570.1 cutinase family protein [Nocardia cyriacigeorgica]
MHFHPTRTRVRSVAIALALAATAAPTATAQSEVTDNTACPVLYVLGVQGDEEGATETGADTGALGQVLGPVSAAAGEYVERAYVPYGHTDDGTPLAYPVAVEDAARRLDDMAAGVVDRCPGTLLAVAGYGHGAAAADQFARDVGSGQSGVDAEQVAAVALLANPARAAGTPVLPGRPQSSTPSPAPGTSGSQVSTITLLTQTPTGAGIASTGTGAPGYGELNGRVADLCVAGDGTCDTPPASPLATAAANIAARSDTGDPIAAITTIATALSATAFTTAVNVVNDDLAGTSLDQLSYQPTKTLGQRLVEASDPATAAPTHTQALDALFKLGTIGFNAAITVARTVITPATVAELATVGMADPLAAVAVLAAKLADAVVELIPPQTASRWVNEAFDAITTTITEPDQLYTLAATAHYSDTTGRHGSYSTVPATSTGNSTLRTVADWLIAIARDAATDPPPESPRPTTSETAPPTRSTPSLQTPTTEQSAVPSRR